MLFRSGVLLQKAIEALDISSVVIVSPSASGQYAIPYIMESRNDDKIAGYIPVAPVIEKEYTVDMFKDLKVGYPLRFTFTLTSSTSILLGSLHIGNYQICLSIIYGFPSEYSTHIQ